MVNPSEALLDIFAYFDPTSLVATSLVCRRFSALIRDDARALAILRKVYHFKRSPVQSQNGQNYFRMDEKVKR